jgi:hypothetical protein
MSILEDWVQWLSIFGGVVKNGPVLLGFSRKCFT